MKLGFDFRWYKYEPCGVCINVFSAEGSDYFEIVGVKVLKFVASIHLKRC